MELKLFDIHCHLNLPEFDRDWPAVLDRTLEGGCWMINVGADLKSSKKAVAIARTKDEGVWATVGFHPTDAIDFSEAAWNEMVELAKDPKVVAIGECGLEYFTRTRNIEDRIKNEIKNKQKQLFRKHIELALSLNKPLMIHCRPALSSSNGHTGAGSMNAYEEAIEILSEYKKEAGDKLRGNFHFFAGDWAIAQKCIELGFTVSFTGVITFARDYDEVIKKIPAGMIMAETDAPFVAPVPYRGKRCEPLYVAEVIRSLAETRGISEQEMGKITVRNARHFYCV